MDAIRPHAVRTLLAIPLLHQLTLFSQFFSETSKRWYVKDGVWLVWWMKYQIFAPILLLQFLNLFWYFLIWRIAFRCVFTSTHLLYVCVLTCAMSQGNNGHHGH